MQAISYHQINTILLPWAKVRGLNVDTECKATEIRTTTIYDAQMYEYDLGVYPDRDTDEELVVVGLCLLKRSNKKHAFYRERRKWDFRVKAALADPESALDESFSRIDRWSAQLASIKVARQDAS